MKLFKVQQPIVVFLKAFGFFAGYHLSPIRSSSWKYFGVQFLHNLMFACLYAFNSSVNLDVFSDYMGDGFKVTSMCTRMERLFSQLAVGNVIYCIFCTSGKQIEFLKCLESIEMEMNGLPFVGMEMDKFYRFLRISSLCSLLMFPFYFFIFLFYSKIVGEIYLIGQIFGTMLYMMYFIFLVAFVLHLVLAIAKFFQVMNINLQAYIDRSDHYQREICFVLRLHNELTSSIQDFNESFGVLIFGTFAFFASVTAIESYFVYATIYSNLLEKSSGFYIYNVCNLIWMFPLCFYLQWFACACSKVQENAEETQRIIERCELGQMPEKMIEKCLLSFSQADYSFTANGFFTIDSSLLYNVSKSFKHLKYFSIYELGFRSQLLFLHFYLLSFNSINLRKSIIQSRRIPKLFNHH